MIFFNVVLQVAAASDMSPLHSIPTTQGFSTVFPHTAGRAFPQEDKALWMWTALAMFFSFSAMGWLRCTDSHTIYILIVIFRLLLTLNVKHTENFQSYIPLLFQNGETCHLSNPQPKCLGTWERKQESPEEQHLCKHCSENFMCILYITQSLTKNIKSGGIKEQYQE